MGASEAVPTWVGRPNRAGSYGKKPDFQPNFSFNRRTTMDWPSEAEFRGNNAGNHGGHVEMTGASWMWRKHRIWWAGARTDETGYLGGVETVIGVSERFKPYGRQRFLRIST